MSRQQRDCPAPGAGRQRGRLATGQPCAVAGQEGRHVVSERACGEQQRGVRGGDTGVVAPIAGAHTGALVVSKQRSFWQEALHSRRPGRRRGTHPGRAHCRAPGRPRVAWRQLRGSNAAWAGSYEEWPGQQPTLAASVPPWMCDADSQRAHLTRMLTTPCARRSGGGVGGGIFDATEISSSRFRRRARCAPMADASNNGGGESGRGLSSLFGLRVRAWLCLLQGTNSEAPGLTPVRSPRCRASSQRGAKGKATKAHLGDELSFYYNEEARAPAARLCVSVFAPRLRTRARAAAPARWPLSDSRRCALAAHLSSRCGWKGVRKPRPRPALRWRPRRSCPALEAARMHSSGAEGAVAVAAAACTRAGAVD